jgi:aryl-alcohol dehydrogenase-like predicted oxidoreductase
MGWPVEETSVINRAPVAGPEPWGGFVLRSRALGQTGLKISEIGFGGWQLGNDDGWGRMSDVSAHRLVETALELGVTLFDTAPHYAATHGERLLGEVLEHVRDQVVLVSKFGHRLDGSKDFSIASFWHELAGSLARLRTDHLDVLLLHNPPGDLLAGNDPIWTALAKAQAQGRILHYGVSLDFAHEAETCLRNTGSTVLEVLFNVFHQDIRRSFSTIREAGAGVIVKVPLDSGWLTGRFDASQRFRGVRSRWTRAQIVQRADLTRRLEWLTESGHSMAHKALAYVLSYDEVSCAIPGMRNVDQLRDNVAAIECALTGEERARLERFWDTITNDGRELLPW